MFLKKIAEPWSTAYSHAAQIELKRNYKLTTIPLLPLQWLVSFDFMPRNVDMADWNNMDKGPRANIFSIMADSCGGHRRCKWDVKFNPEMGLYVSFRDMDEFGRHGFSDTLILPHFAWTNVQLSQETECGQIVHRVIINGVEKYRKEVESARKITNLNLNIASSYFPIPERGYMKGLSIQIKEETKPERISHRDL